MKRFLLLLPLLSLALVPASCSTEERDGRKYYIGNTPIQGRMGVHHMRRRDPAATSTRVDDGTLFGASTSNEPPGLLDRNSSNKPAEPAGDYWIHAQQSPNPVQGRMGVQVSRRKK